MQATIRKAELSDAAGIARVHVASWQNTYEGILPDDLLKGLTLANRSERWQETLKNLPEDQCVVICEKEEEIVGFARGGPERGRQTDYAGEVYAIYLLEKAQGRGYGQRLVQAVVHDLLEADISTMIIWVAKENDSRFFYEAIGGVAVTEGTIDVKGTVVDEIGYGWQDIRTLLE